MHRDDWFRDKKSDAATEAHLNEKLRDDLLFHRGDPCFLSSFVSGFATDLTCEPASFWILGWEMGIESTPIDYICAVIAPRTYARSAQRLRTVRGGVVAPGPWWEKRSVPYTLIRNVRQIWAPCTAATLLTCQTSI